MKLRMNRIGVLNQVVGTLLDSVLEPETAFKVATNHLALNTAAEKLQKAYKPVDGHDKVRGQYQEAAKQFGGVQNPDGTTTIDSKSATKLQAEINRINVKYSDIVEAQKAYDEKFNLMLEKEIEVELEVLNKEELTAAIKPRDIVILMDAGILK